MTINERRSLEEIKMTCIGEKENRRKGEKKKRGKGEKGKRRKGEREKMRKG